MQSARTSQTRHLQYVGWHCAIKECTLMRMHSHEKRRRQHLWWENAQNLGSVAFTCASFGAPKILWKHPGSYAPWLIGRSGVKTRKIAIRRSLRVSSQTRRHLQHVGWHCCIAMNPFSPLGLAVSYLLSRSWCTPSQMYASRCRTYCPEAVVRRVKCMHISLCIQN